MILTEHSSFEDGRSDESFEEIKMDEDFSFAMKHIGGNVSYLNSKWDFYSVMYGDLESIELLNATSSGAFSLFRELLVNDFILGCSKLLDASKIRNDRNVSLKYLLEEIRPKITKAQHSDLVDRLEKITQKLESVRHFRHKILAHSDLESCKLGSLSVEINVDSGVNILEEIMGFLNQINWITSRSYRLYNRGGVPLHQYALHFKRQLSKIKHSQI